MITANIIHRVFFVKVGNSTGTAFTVDVDNKQYLITAKHLIQLWETNDEFNIFSNGKWVPLSIKVVGHGKESIDISVLAPSILLTPTGLPLKYSTNGLIYGQDSYFLGFPYGLTGKSIFTEAGFPMPFVKKGVISYFEKGLLYLDGHNNPGFSGGPVVFGSPGNAVTNIAGVISGYKSTFNPVLIDKKPTEYSFQENTGIIIVYPIENAIDIIDANPIGFQIINTGTII